MKRKVAAGGVGGSIVTLVLTIVGGFGIHLDANVGAALTTLVGVAIAYFIPELDTSVPVGSPEPPTTP